MAQVKHVMMLLKRGTWYIKSHFTSIEQMRAATTTKGVDTVEGFIVVVEEYQDLEWDLKMVNTPVESQYRGGQKETPFQQGRWPLYEGPAGKGYKPYRDKCAGGNKETKRSRSVKNHTNKNITVCALGIELSSPQLSSKG